MTRAHLFVDESKRNDYVLVSAAVPTHLLRQTRATIRELLLPRQSSIHMKNESAGRRAELLTAVRSLDLELTIYVAVKSSHPTQVRGRDACIERLVADAIASEAERIVFDLDLTLIRPDRRSIVSGAWAVGHATVPFRYEHAKASQEPLLAIPDIVGWSWSRGGRWRAALRDAVTEVRV